MDSGAVSLELPGLFPEAGAGVQLWEPEEQHMELCVMIPGVLLRVSVSNCTKVSVVVIQNSVWILWRCYNGNSVHSVVTAKIHYLNSCLPTLMSVVAVKGSKWD